MNYDYEKIAKEVIQAVGGSENIKSAAHCATRLRLIVADRSLADDDKVGEIDAVKGTFFTAGQYQIIFGTGHVNRVYEQITRLGIAETTASEAKEAKMDGKNQLQKAIRTFGDVFVPVIPALVATGLFLGLKGALLNDNFLALFGMTNADIPQTFQVLVEVLSGTTFAFLPAIVCWSTFRVFGGSPVLGLILGLMLVNGALPNAYSVADPASGVTPLMLFGLIPIVGYQGSILPAFIVYYADSLAAGHRAAAACTGKCPVSGRRICIGTAFGHRRPDCWVFLVYYHPYGRPPYIQYAGNQPVSEHRF